MNRCARCGLVDDICPHCEDMADLLAAELAEGYSEQAMLDAADREARW